MNCFINSRSSGTTFSLRAICRRIEYLGIEICVIMSYDLDYMKVGDMGRVKN